MAEQCRVRCRVRRGSFEEEMVARIQIVDAAGHDIEAECWVHKDSVTVTQEPQGNAEVEGDLRAYCLERRNQYAAVVLPQSTFQNGPSVVVRESTLLSGAKE